MDLHVPLRRLAHLGPEATRFAIVGLSGVAVQIVAFNLLRYAGPHRVGVLFGRPVTAQVLSIGLATVVTYLGNRYWTYRHRARGNPWRELPIFLLLNGIAIVIGALCLALSHYALGLTSPLADNLSGNVVGLGLGTLFRFWSYRRFVFTGQHRASVAARSADAAPDAVSPDAVSPDAVSPDAVSPDAVSPDAIDSDPASAGRASR